MQRAASEKPLRQRQTPVLDLMLQAWTQNVQAQASFWLMYTVTWYTANHVCGEQIFILPISQLALPQARIPTTLQM